MKKGPLEEPAQTDSSLDRHAQQKAKAAEIRKMAYARAKEHKKKFLQLPEVQKKLLERRLFLKSLRDKKSASMKVQKKQSKVNDRLKKSSELESKRSLRDEELKQFVTPALVLLKGGKS
jgi:hypothetical protein